LSPVEDPAAAAPAATALPSRATRWPVTLAVLALLVTAVALALAWNTQQRVRSLEQELVKRQSQSQTDAAEARAIARAAQDVARESAAKTALLEARVVEASMQRSQIEELLQSVARSRDENVVADVDAAIRVALQQSAITGSAEPLVATLKQADERLARYNQPRLERVRRAVLRDLDRAKALGTVDVSALTARLDEAVRLVDELPLLSLAVDARSRGSAASSAAAAAAAASAAAVAPADWRARSAQWWRDLTGRIGDEARALVRVTRVEQGDAALLAPDQQFFVRENLKLRLLNARLALFARQYDSAQADLREAEAMLTRYFDRTSKRHAVVLELLRQTVAQARQTAVPRPDETLTALATAAAGR
jgi:uroporphyrin-3 C-methyltransferase